MVIFLLIWESKICQDNFPDNDLPEELLYFLSLSFISHYQMDHFLHEWTINVAYLYYQIPLTKSLLHFSLDILSDVSISFCKYKLL